MNTLNFARRAVAAAGFVALTATGAAAFAAPASAAPAAVASSASADHSCPLPPKGRVQHAGWTDSATKHVHKKSHHKKSNHKRVHVVTPPKGLCG